RPAAGATVAAAGPARARRRDQRRSAARAHHRGAARPVLHHARPRRIMKKKRRLLYGVALVATIGAVGTAWALYGRAEAAPTGRPHTVTRGDVIELAAASGSIEPSVQVEVKSRASGEVIEVLVEEGQ